MLERKRDELSKHCQCADEMLNISDIYDQSHLRCAKI